MWSLILLFSFQTLISVFATVTDNGNLKSLAVQLNHLETAIDDEIQETNNLVYLIKSKSSSQRSTPGKILFKLFKFINNNINF